MSMPGTLRMAMIRGNKRKRIALVIVALFAALAGAALLGLHFAAKERNSGNNQFLACDKLK